MHSSNYFCFRWQSRSLRDIAVLARVTLVSVCHDFPHIKDLLLGEVALSAPPVPVLEVYLLWPYVVNLFDSLDNITFAVENLTYLTGRVSAARILL